MAGSAGSAANQPVDPEPDDYEAQIPKKHLYILRHSNRPQASRAEDAELGEVNPRGHTGILVPEDPTPEEGGPRGGQSSDT